MNQWLPILGLILSVGFVRADAPDQTLTLDDCLARALTRNPAILKAQEELRRTRGLIVEARAPALPQLTASGEYRETDINFIDAFPGTAGGPAENQERPWAASVEVSQLLYSGGRVRAAWRAARLADQIAVLDFNRTVADTLLQVQRTFYEVLLNTQLIGVREQSIELLTRQLEDTRHRFDVGAVPQFNVLRAEVELANARPPLIRARNNLRLAKERLVTLLAWDNPAATTEFTPVNFAGTLDYILRSVELINALATAREQRPELAQAERQVTLQRENVRVARAGDKPEVALFAAYGLANTRFGDDVGETIDGWTAGVRATWPLFDGLLTKGKVDQARAELAKAELDAADSWRAVELEVREAYSAYLQARELLDAQKKTVEQAVESLRLAEARFRAGSGTQLDVLSAQTALTEARSNEVQALYDYHVALATMDRATGTAVRPAE